MKKHKVIALISGGLDSTLAAKMMLEQDLEVTGFNMTSPFCTCTPKKSGCGNLAKQMADQLGIEMVIKAKGLEYVDVVRKPKFGYGRGLNPCIDCRIFTFKKAGELMKEKGARAIVTGEILGQRPMSQRKDAMHKIEKESGLKGMILRPLSAHHFPETEIEKEGIVNRSELLGISGRQRTTQLQMAEDKGLMGISCGTGGCLLTDVNMKKKLIDLFEHKQEIALSDLRRLRIGRHFRLEDGTKLILGRDKTENDRLEQERRPAETLMTPISSPGPTALIEAPAPDFSAQLVGNIMLAFSKCDNAPSLEVSIQDSSGINPVKVLKKEMEFRNIWISKTDSSGPAPNGCRSNIINKER